MVYFGFGIGVTAALWVRRYLWELLRPSGGEYGASPQE